MVLIGKVAIGEVVALRVLCAEWTCARMRNFGMQAAWSARNVLAELSRESCKVSLERIHVESDGWSLCAGHDDTPDKIAVDFENISAPCLLSWCSLCCCGVWCSGICVKCDVKVVAETHLGVVCSLARLRVWQVVALKHVQWKA